VSGQPDNSLVSQARGLPNPPTFRWGWSFADALKGAAGGAVVGYVSGRLFNFENPVWEAVAVAGSFAPLFLMLGYRFADPRESPLTAKYVTRNPLGIGGVAFVAAGIGACLAALAAEWAFGWGKWPVGAAGGIVMATGFTVVMGLEVHPLRENPDRAEPGAAPDRRA
jgi:hypothetical protein